MASASHKAGFVNIIGKPNVGKSTLMNTLVGEKLSITTEKAQTTRHSIVGICDGNDFQIIYIDTPGIMIPHYALQRSMMRSVHSALAATDVLLWLVDIRDQELPTCIKEILSQQNVPKFLILNKVDLVDPARRAKAVQYWSNQVSVNAVMPVSALHNFNIPPLLTCILPFLPTHPPYYPKHTLTDRPARFFVADIIREKILRNYHQEIPYSVEVVIDTFKQVGDIVKIRAVINTERKSQKNILIGRRGYALKKVGIEARHDLELFLGKKVFLEQHVEVVPDWRTRSRLLHRFGYR